MKWNVIFTVAILLIPAPRALGTDAVIACLTSPHISAAHVPDSDVTIDNGYTNFVTDPVDIPITFDIARKLDISVPDGVEMNVPIAFISVYRDGRIMYDGRDISGRLDDGCNNDTGTNETEQQQSTAKHQDENGDNADTGRKLP